jgi:hypothetical protein
MADAGRARDQGRRTGGSDFATPDGRVGPVVFERQVRVEPTAAAPPGDPRGVNQSGEAPYADWREMSASGDGKPADYVSTEHLRARQPTIDPLAIVAVVVATASTVLVMVGLLWPLSIVVAFLGFGLGVASLRRISADRTLLKGRWLAITAIVIPYVGFAVLTGPILR